MPKLILKSPYLKCGGKDTVSGYLRNIGTRDGVELVPDGRPVTKRQEQLIRALVRDFPGSKELLEYTNCDHCAGWVMLCSDAAFGDLPWRRVDDPCWEDIRVGDVIDYRNEQSGHAIVVIEKTDEHVKVTESGMNNHALWGGQYPRWWLEQQPGYCLNTRYPE